MTLTAPSDKWMEQAESIWRKSMSSGSDMALDIASALEAADRAAREDCATIALNMFSGRGNEFTRKEIAATIRRTIGGSK